MDEYLNVDDIHKELTELLLIFKDICDRNGLRFYLAGGTMLGAVRHKGFIPWDDDIDVMMPRPDYDRLLNLIRENRVKGMPDFCDFESYELNNAARPFLKMIHKNILIDSEFYDDGFLWIDIFPVDGLPGPEKNKEVKRVYKQCEVVRRILLLNLADDSKGAINGNKAKSLLKKVLIPIAKIFGIDWCSKKIIKLEQEYPYDMSKYVGVVGWGLYGPGERMKKEDFEKSTQVMFEGNEMPAMSCWKEYLTNLYGNYMELPGESERVAHNMKAHRVNK